MSHITNTWIVSRNPEHGVLAIGEVTIDSTIKIKGIRLLRNNRTNGYRVILPKLEGRKSSSIDVDKDILNKMVDSLAACYEKGARTKSSLLHTSADQFEQETLHQKKQKHKKSRNNEFYKSMRG